MISWKISWKIKKSRRISISKKFLRKFKVEIDQLRVHYQKFGLQLSQPDYSVRIQWRLTQKKFMSLWDKLLFLGQASSSISYYRRFYMLFALTSSSQQSKQMLREDSEFLQKNNKNLFGKKFDENIWQTFKSKKQTLDMLSNTSRTKYKQPYSHGFPQTLGGSFGGQ